MTKVIPIECPGGGECGQKSYLRGSSPSVLIPGHDRELFAPYFCRVGSFLSLKLAGVMHVESICLPDKLVELLEGQKELEGQGIKSHRKGRGHLGLS